MIRLFVSLVCLFLLSCDNNNAQSLGYSVDSSFYKVRDSTPFPMNSNKWTLGKMERHDGPITAEDSIDVIFLPDSIVRMQLDSYNVYRAKGNYDAMEYSTFKEYYCDGTFTYKSENGKIVDTVATGNQECIEFVATTAVIKVSDREWRFLYPEKYFALYVYDNTIEVKTNLPTRSIGNKNKYDSHRVKSTMPIGFDCSWNIDGFEFSVNPNYASDLDDIKTGSIIHFKHSYMLSRKIDNSIDIRIDTTLNKSIGIAQVHYNKGVPVLTANGVFINSVKFVEEKLVLYTDSTLPKNVIFDQVSKAINTPRRYHSHCSVYNGYIEFYFYDIVTNEVVFAKDVMKQGVIVTVKWDVYSKK